jgi:hypothetical protein
MNHQPFETWLLDEQHPEVLKKTSLILTAKPPALHRTG